MTTLTTAGQHKQSPANRLGLDYRAEAGQLPYVGAIIDVHTHIHSLADARRFFAAADVFGIERIWSMSPLEEVDAIRSEFGDRVQFIAVPDYRSRDKPGTFTTDWLHRIEKFAQKGARVCKFWAAPRGLDFSDDLRIDAPVRDEAMTLAHSLGMMMMTHIADPDTWFATHYKDAKRYGTKADQYVHLERWLEKFSDVPWLAAHLAGDPEHLDHLQTLLDRYPHLHLDTAATKWMVRELSKHPAEFADFVRRNPGRVLFGSDVVTNGEQDDFDLYASRYWALRTLMETDYDGPSPIVDPDLPLVDPTLPATATAHLHGCGLDATTLTMLYHEAAEKLEEKMSHR